MPVVITAASKAKLKGCKPKIQDFERKLENIGDIKNELDKIGAIENKLDKLIEHLLQSKK